MPNDYTFSVGGTILYTTALESISVGLNQATTDLTVKANPADGDGGIADRHVLGEGDRHRAGRDRCPHRRCPD